MEPRTRPRLRARSPSAFCDHAADDPAIGTEATKVSPTRMCWTSVGLCHARKVCDTANT